MDSVLSLNTVETLNFLQAKIPVELQRPAAGIICGSGLEGLANNILPHPRLEIPYADIPHFPHSTGKHKWQAI